MVLGTAWKRAVFNAWMRIVATIAAEAATTEVEHLKMRIQGESSIWSMRKEELIEVARRELNFTRTMAEKETVLTLRELIRRKRKDEKYRDDPLNTEPKRLSGMGKAELVEEALKRDLPTEGQTRSNLLLMIRDDLSQRAIMHGPPLPVYIYQTHTVASQSSTSELLPTELTTATVYRSGGQVANSAVQDENGTWTIVPTAGRAVRVAVPKEPAQPLSKRGYRQ